MWTSIQIEQHVNHSQILELNKTHLHFGLFFLTVVPESMPVIVGIVDVDAAAAAFADVGRIVTASAAAACDDGDVRIGIDDDAV